MTANCVSAHFIFCSFCFCAVKNAEVPLHHSLLMVLQTQQFFFLHHVGCKIFDTDRSSDSLLFFYEK